MTGCGSGEPGSDLPRLFSGSDVAKGIAALRGDEKLYRKLINEFIRSHGEDDARIGAVLAAGDGGKASKMVHALRGVAGNLAVSEVYRITTQLDGALRHGRPEVVERLLPQLTEALAQIRSDAQLLRDEPPPVMSLGSVRTPDLAEVVPLLEKLVALLRQRRMAVLDLLPRLAELLAGTSLEPEMLLLLEAAERLEFVVARSMAETLMSRLAEFESRETEDYWRSGP